MIRPLCPNCEDIELIKHAGWRYDLWACPSCYFAEWDALHTKVA